MAHSRQLINLADAQPPFFAAADVGGTNIKLGLVDDEGRPLAYESMPTEEEQGPQQAVERISRS